MRPRGIPMLSPLLPLLLLLLLAGCPSSTTGGGSSREAGTAAACTHVGQTCEYAPNKLGSCVQKDDCSTGDCLVCQSQH
jgi:hypothetical protein